MEFSEQFIQIIDRLCEKFGLMIDWSAKNIGPYLSDLGHRLIQYELLTSIAWMFLPLIGIICSIVVMLALRKRIDWNEDISYNYFFVGAIAIFIISCLLGTLIWIDQVGDIITCCTLPEKIIIEFFKIAVN